MVTADDLRRVSELAEAVLTGLSLALRSADRYAARSDSVQAGKFIGILSTLDNDRGRLQKMLSDGADMVFAAEHHGPVILGGPPCASAHEAIAIAAGRILGTVSVAAAKAANDDDVSSYDDSPPLFLYGRETFIRGHVAVAARAFREGYTGEWIDDLSASARQELARALRSLPTERIPATSAVSVVSGQTQFDALTRALACLAKSDPGATVAKIADDVGCSKQYLYGNETFMGAWNVFKNNLKSSARVIRGSKSKDGQLEAIDPD